MSVTLRAIDPTIVQAIAEAPVQDNGLVDMVPIAEKLEISYEYLRARLRRLRASGNLSSALCAKIRWGKPPIAAETVIAAWEQSPTVAEVARRTGLSRSGVLQRIAKLRAARGDDGSLLHPDLQERPHQAVSKEARQHRLRDQIGAAG